MNKKLTGNETGLIAYYNMDSGGNGDGGLCGTNNICDKSGNNYTGIRH